MPDSPKGLHQRYLQQAGWTAAIRQQAFHRFNVKEATRILEVGSGTGAITAELRRASPGAVIGLDRDRRASEFARRTDPRSAFVTGVGEGLPFPSRSFDIVCCHFLLLWVDDPLAILVEMLRVTRPGGAVLCLAEPDYGGRIEYPDSLAVLGAAQEAALRRHGAETRLGRRLRQLLVQARLDSVEVGVLGGEWRAGTIDGAQEAELEWKTLADDLEGDVSPGALEDLRRQLTAARNEGRHLLFIPTFYGWGLRPR
jgi:SAM-dependent methyltransferase